MKPIHIKFNFYRVCVLSFFLMAITTLQAQTVETNGIIAIQSDLGLKDPRIAMMKAIALRISPNITFVDINNEIPAFNIWEASFFLYQSILNFPKGTVFISIVDPTVGTNTKSIVILTTSGHYIITPDNGTISLVSEITNFQTVREIDLNKNRLDGSSKNFTFLGRDVYANIGAKLAKGIIKFEDVGPVYSTPLTEIQHQKPEIDNQYLKACIIGAEDIFGNLWTNISTELWQSFGVGYGDRLETKIYNNNDLVFSGTIPFLPTFSSAAQGKPLFYVNHTNNICLALYLDNFSKRYDVHDGPEWSIKIKKVK
ncbi:MAG: SAM-dependent chlorinase/fluorinase [Alphaproteobacteria bacterium]|nr:SAM-dependent chlorinase/fluorinase [Alphaproteobacteria bacterium]